MQYSISDICLENCRKKIKKMFEQFSFRMVMKKYINLICCKLRKNEIHVLNEKSLKIFTFLIIEGNSHSHLIAHELQLSSKMHIYQSSFKNALLV